MTCWCLPRLVKAMEGNQYHPCSIAWAKGRSLLSLLESAKPTQRLDRLLSKHRDINVKPLTITIYPPNWKLKILTQTSTCQLLCSLIANVSEASAHQEMPILCPPVFVSLHFFPIFFSPSFACSGATSDDSQEFLLALLLESFLAVHRDWTQIVWAQSKMLASLCYFSSLVSVCHF